MAVVLTDPPTSESAEIPDEDARQSEVIDGVRVRLPEPTADSSAVASALAYHLMSYGLEHSVGKAYRGVLISLTLPEFRQRRPSVIFVPFSRWPEKRPTPETDHWDILPELCVEVVSPNDKASDLREKVLEYLRAGVRQVWVVYPRHAVIDVHDSPESVRVLHRGGELDGGDLLPGFRLKLVELFLAPDESA